MKRIILALAVMLTAMAAFAQATWSDQILTNNDNSGAPVAALNWKYGIGQCIYTASEINLPHSSISGIALCLAEPRQYPDTTAYEIWLGTTSKTTFTDRYDFIPESQLTKVFDGEVVHPYAADAWNYITFDTPFEYDGTSNLVLYMVNKTGSFANDYPFYHFDESVANSHITAYDDNAMFRPQTMTYQSSAVNASRPWIKLNYEEIEDFNLSIGETFVNSFNCNDIPSEHITSGKVSFDPETNTLLLNNLVMSYSETINASLFSRGDLTIEVRGTCNVGRIEGSGRVNTTIVGDTSATINATVVVIHQSGRNEITLTIKDLNINVHDPEDSYTFGIYGYGGEENIVFDNCHCEAKVGICPVDEFKSITLRNCDIVYPVGAVVEDGCIRVNGSHDIDSVCIERNEHYGIIFTNIEVTAANADNITGDYITSGTASFDAETNTLTINDLATPVLYTTAFTRGDLTIRVVGSCQITSGPLFLPDSVNCTLTGTEEDTLRVKQVNGMGKVTPIHFNVSGLNFLLENENSPVFITLQEHVLNFDNCHLEARTSTFIPYKVQDITFTGCEIVYPVGAEVVDGQIVLNGSTQLDSVCIERIPSSLTLTSVTEFSVIPNPAVDVVTLSGVELAADGYMTMTDASGRRVAAIKIPASESDYTMDVAALPAGVYYITITSGTTRYHSTLIKK